MLKIEKEYGYNNRSELDYEEKEKIKKVLV